MSDVSENGSMSAIIHMHAVWIAIVFLTVWKPCDQIILKLPVREDSARKVISPTIKYLYAYSLAVRQLL